MALEHNDIVMLKEEFDERYVMQKDCNDTQEKINKRFAADDKRIEIIAHDFKIIKWLVSTVAASSIGALIVSIFEIILR